MLTDLLQALKSYNVDRSTQVDEVVLLDAVAQILANGYSAHGMPTPEWLSKRLVALNREVQLRFDGLREKRKTEIRQALLSMDPAMRKAALERELAELESAAPTQK